ncbi:MAG: DUF1016 N-terminal domain-containing protein [Pleurocapsa sp. MO_192.B19]|nr:DUF1016 N-terminal domain-containing protein [Pleurocapsa sp. MO_192.B19]
MSPKKEIFFHTEGYRVFLAEIKQNIQSAQIKTALSVNRSLIELYLDIGEKILLKQEQEKWGKSVVESLSKDLKKSFPHLKGFSARNLWDMRRLGESVRSNRILRQLVAEIPVCQAWPTTWRWKSSTQPDGGEGIGFNRNYFNRLIFVKIIKFIIIKVF